MTEQQVLSVIKSYRRNHALHTIDPNNCKALEECNQVNAWLHLLPLDERIIVQKHLIDGLDWTRTAAEIDHIWGYKNGRSERTLKRKQATAIKRICDFMNKHT